MGSSFWEFCQVLRCCMYTCTSTSWDCGAVSSGRRCCDLCRYLCLGVSDIRVSHDTICVYRGLAPCAPNTFGWKPPLFHRCSPLRSRHCTPKVLNVLEEDLPCVRYDGWGNLTPSGYFKFDLGAYARAPLLRFSENRCLQRHVTKDEI